jgi:hypothetical protein
MNVPSQALLVRKGNVKRTNAQVNQALRDILQRKWSDESDSTAVAKSDPEADPTAFKIKKAIALVKAGHISRATKSLFQGNFLALDSTVIKQLQLHPPKDEKSKMPDLPDSIPAIDVDMSKLVKLIDTKLKNGSAPGPSGWTGELLGTLVGDSECSQGLAVLIEDMINGNFGDQAREYLMASRLIPLGKEGGGVRPIAINETFYKLATLYVLSLVKHLLPDFFEPIQLGLGARGGAERAVHIVQTALDG